jgi:hypothetical protein
MFVSDDELKRRFAALASPGPLKNNDGEDIDTEPVSDSELDKSDEDNGEVVESNLSIEKIHRGGRKNGSVEIPVDVKAEAIVTSRIIGQTKAAEMFSMTQPQLNKYANHGLDNNTKSKELQRKVKTEEELARIKAIDTMMQAMGMIGSKLDEVKKAGELSAIAANMARCADKLRGRDEESEQRNNLKIVIFAPRIKTENEYEVVEA